MTVSGYVPFFNNRDTVTKAVRSLQNQSVPLCEVFAVDDGSTDNGASLLDAFDVEVLKLTRNAGRGAARARAMAHAKSDLVVGCDATVELPPDFVARASAYFGDPAVAGVYGSMGQHEARDLAARWRGRHLFKTEQSPMGAVEVATFATYGAVLRRDAVLSVGNFNPDLRYAEDAELGHRLHTKGWKLIMDPGLIAYCVSVNSIPEVLERYWRWHSHPGARVSPVGFLKDVSFAIKVLAREDLRKRDPGCAVISLMTPFYRVFQTVRSKRQRC